MAIDPQLNAGLINLEADITRILVQLCKEHKGSDFAMFQALKTISAGFDQVRDALPQVPVPENEPIQPEAIQPEPAPGEDLQHLELNESAVEEKKVH